MELSFQTSQLRYLRRVAHELRYQEETADTIVPDSYPDISAIADCFATVVLRGKDCRDGSVTVSGGIKAAILCEPEDGSIVRRLELYIPFTTKFENSTLTERSQVQCELRVRSVDARMINSRKAMLRVNLGCEMNAYEEAEETMYSLQEPASTLQVKENTCTVSIPLEACERSFVVNDTLELPTGRPDINEIYKVCCCPEITDQKLVGNKGIFKGTLWCKIAYLSADGSFNVWQHQLPFSQYCEFSREYDNETQSVLPVITGYDLEPEPGAENRRLELTVHLLAQCLVTGSEPIQLLEDAYSTEGTLQPQWAECVMECILDHQTGAQNVRHSMTGTLRDVLDVEIYPDFASCKQQDDRSKISVPLYARIVGYDPDGRLCSLTGKTEAVQEFALHDRAGVKVALRPVTDACASIGTDGVDLRCSVGMDSICYANQTLRTLSGGMVEPAVSAEERPSVILRFAGKDETLWSIAKSCGASVASVRAVNRLENDKLQPGVMLLIPIG